MVENTSIGVDSFAVQKHVEIMQDVIRRMADNSRSCKVWCVTLVAATLVLVARTGEPRHALIALVPTALFLVLDTYYLALERAFRNSYNAFVRKLHRGELVPLDIFPVKPAGMGWKLAWRCLGSVSILPFYLLLTVTVLLAWLLIIPSDTILR